MDKRRTDTKEKIIRMTEQALAKTDYTELSLRDIAKKCEISATTMYKHFSNKDDLFQHVHSQLAEKKLRDYQALNPDSDKPDFKDQILRLAIYILNEFKTVPKIMTFIFFSPYAVNTYPKKADNSVHSLNLLDEYTKYISGLKNQYKLSESEDSLFIRLWSFLQGYSLLISQKITQIDEKIIKQTLNDFMAERR